PHRRGSATSRIPRRSRARACGQSPTRRGRRQWPPSRGRPACRRSTGSRGTRRLADLARAIAHRPRVLYRGEHDAVVRAHAPARAAADAADDVGARAALVDGRGALEGEEPALRLRPEQVAAIPPPDCKTRWHGTMKGTGLRPSAVPT